ncbi:hypothetical protein, partial [Sinorhizobium fredii]
TTAAAAARIPEGVTRTNTEITRIPEGATRIKDRITGSPEEATRIAATTIRVGRKRAVRC